MRQSYDTWTTGEVRTLRSLVGRGLTYAQIGYRMNRSGDSVENQARRNGFKNPKRSMYAI